MQIEEISLDEIQARILAGETLSVEEYKQIIAAYRASRTAAAAAPAARKSKKASPETSDLPETP